MNVLKIFSDLTAVLKRPVEKAPKLPAPEYEAVEKMEKEELHLTFKEAQQAGFQFCYTRHKSVIITSICVSSDKIIIPAYIDNHLVARIGSGCRFINKKHISDITLILPDTLETIGENAFSKAFMYDYSFYVPQLSEVYFPKGSIRIEKDAFRNQKKLKRLHFGDTAVIGEYAFNSCESLEKVRLNNCELSKRCFDFCQRLTDVTWKKVLFSEDSVFEATPFEEKHDLLITGNVLQRCRTNKSCFVVPDGISFIGREAFRDNMSLERVVLPPSVIRIGVEAFVNCQNLRYIDLSRVGVIDSDAFGNCQSLDPKTKFEPNTKFMDCPFRQTPLEANSVTNDGIVINRTLIGGRPIFSGNVWQISQNVRRIAGNQLSFDFDAGLSNIPDMTVVFPESVECINNIKLFCFAKRLVFKNPRVKFFNSNGFSANDITLTFIDKNGSSDIPVIFPKKIGNNPAFRNTLQLYSKVFGGAPDINAYDKEIFETGMPMHMLIGIAYKRLSGGGYKLTDESRRRYKEYLRLHIRRALAYAEKYGDTELLDFLHRKFPI